MSCKPLERASQRPTYFSTERLFLRGSVCKRCNDIDSTGRCVRGGLFDSPGTRRLGGFPLPCFRVGRRPHLPIAGSGRSHQRLGISVAPRRGLVRHHYRDAGYLRCGGELVRQVHVHRQTVAVCSHYLSRGAIAVRQVLLADAGRRGTANSPCLVIQPPPAS